MFPSYLPARCRCGEAGRHVFAAGRVERPVPRPRPGGRLDALVRYARELRETGFDVLEDASTFAAVAGALLIDIRSRRGAFAMWRHARRVVLVLERAFVQAALEERAGEEAR